MANMENNEQQFNFQEEGPNRVERCREFLRTVWSWIHQHRTEILVVIIACLVCQNISMKLTMYTEDQVKEILKLHENRAQQDCNDQKRDLRDDMKTDCNSEKNQLSDNLTDSCNKEKQELESRLITNHADEKLKITNEMTKVCNAEKYKMKDDQKEICVKEKQELISSMTTVCNNEKSKIKEDAMKECNIEKAQMKIDLAEKAHKKRKEFENNQTVICANEKLQLRIEMTENFNTIITEKHKLFEDVQTGCNQLLQWTQNRAIGLEQEVQRLLDREANRGFFDNFGGMIKNLGDGLQRFAPRKLLGVEF